MAPSDDVAAADGGSLQLQPMPHEAQGAVADGAADGAGAGAAPPESAAEKFMSVLKSMLFRGMMIYFVVQLFRRPGANQAPADANAPATVSTAATNLFLNGTLMDLYVFLSEQEEFGDFNNSDALIWKKEALEYGDWYSGESADGTYTFSTKIASTEHLRNNGSMFMHTFIVKHGKSPDPSTGKGRFSKKWTLYKSRRMNKFKKKYYRKTTNLLTGETEATEEEQAKMAEGISQEIFSHWHPNITINIVNDFTAWTPGQIPPPLDTFVEFTPSLQHYKPIMYLNDYWNLNKDFHVINSTVDTLNFTVTFQPLSMFKFQMYSSQQMKNKWNMMGNLMGEENGEEDDQDSLKEALLETNIYLLVLTVVVSIVHSIFEFLAFKNDIQFWNNRKSLEGLSVRSVFFNVFQSLVVLLYVLDNETNTVIKISCFVGLAIEIWKINKVSDLSFDRSDPLFGFLPRPVFKDKEGSYEESGTKEYDRMAFKYLGMALFPLAFCYCIYSMIYNEHKGWYSFVLSSTYGFLLMFGFIMMTPQLFINYKLKSVAHLPWRMLTYKALNTFIDDIFAFVIKMPTMYRIGCFRDDIVFFIFLYQKYVYRVDHSRVNEFGYSGDMLDEVNKPKVEQEGQRALEEKDKDEDEDEMSATATSRPKSARAKKAD